MSATAESRPYRIPNALRDLVMLDLLELTGSTTGAAALLGMSQPTVSRRYNSIARDLGLKRQGEAPPGRRFADAPWVPWLRRGVNHHRLAHGVIRVGGHHALEGAIAESALVQWVRLGRQQQRDWRPLLTLELLDAVALKKRPELAVEEMVSMALVDVHGERNVPVVLACRRDPLVLAICGELRT